MRKGKLTDQQRQQVISEYLAGDGSSVLAKRYGVHENSILKLLKKSGTPIRARRFVTPEEDKKIVELYASGLSMQDVSEEMGLAGVFQRLKKNNVKSRSPEESHRIFELREDFFDVIDTEEKAYFLGFLYADGCNQMMHYYGVSLALEVSDKEILDKLARIIYCNEETAQHMIKISDRRNEEIDRGVTANLTINSKHICLQLNQIGCVPQKTFKLTYPTVLGEGMDRHFIRGYFDGDGTINDVDKKASGCKIVSTKEFCEGVKARCNKINIQCSIYKENRTNDKNTYVLYWSGNRNIQRILTWMYEGSTIYLERKYARFPEFKEKMVEIDELIEAGTRGYSKKGLAKSKLPY